MALPFYMKKYLKGKRRIMETQIIHQCKRNNLYIKKKPSKKETKILQEIIITL